MPKTKSEKTTSKAKKSATKVSKVDSISSQSDTPKSIRNLRPSRKLIVIIVVLLLATLAYYKKGWFIAASVNGQPITTLEVQTKLNKLYKERVVSQMIMEAVINQFIANAAKQGVTITQPEIDAKLVEIENQYGGKEAFASLLQQNAVTKEDFTKEIKVNLLGEKLYQNEIKPTPEEIQKFLEDNKDAPEATDSAQITKIANEQIKQQKLSKVLSEKIQELKSKAVTY